MRKLVKEYPFVPIGYNVLTKCIIIRPPACVVVVFHVAQYFHRTVMAIQHREGSFFDDIVSNNTEKVSD
jgi:hypothetical protein